MNASTSILVLLASTFANCAFAQTKVREVRRFQVPEAHQAVAVDESSFYAISNRTIARYGRREAKRLAKWTAPTGSPIIHLNSGMVHEGKLYCANSNWPKKPLRNTLEVFDASTLRHLNRREFAESEGAINWVERHRGAWWIVFAHYGEQHVRRTRLHRYDDRWRRTGVWSFPETVIRRFLPNSNSGGAFGPDGRLYVTGHDHAELYELDVPDEPGELKHRATVPAPIAGQGVAWDDADDGVLLGIVRKNRQVVFMRMERAASDR